jgi:hypothetical protein
MGYNRGMSDSTTQANTRVLSNGAVYDLDAKRIVANPGGGKYAITSETASEYHAMRQERKREAVARGAMAAVTDRFPERLGNTDLDYIEAIAQQVTYKALDKRDPKQVDAARFVFSETGNLEARQIELQQAPTQVNVAVVVASSVAERVLRLVLAEQAPIVDADSNDG